MTEPASNVCTTDACTGKRPPKEKAEPEHFAFKPKIKEMLKADEDAGLDPEEDEEEEVTESMEYVLGIRDSYAKGKYPPPEDLIKRLEKLEAKEVDCEENPTVDEEIARLEDKFDARGEVLRITRRKSVKLKNHAANEASITELKRIKEA